MSGLPYSIVNNHWLYSMRSELPALLFYLTVYFTFTMALVFFAALCWELSKKVKTKCQKTSFSSVIPISTTPTS
jgi:hypothetical protein